MVDLRESRRKSFGFTFKTIVFNEFYRDILYEDFGMYILAENGNFFVELSNFGYILAFFLKNLSKS